MCSNSMSYCCPSHTPVAISLNHLRTCGSLGAGTCANSLYASMSIWSPERMAVLSFHFTCTVSCPRRTSARSITSSWTSVKLWNTSKARAAGSTSSIELIRPPLITASAAMIAKCGRRRLPPEAKVYSMGSYKPLGSLFQFNCAISLLISTISIINWRTCFQ